MGWFRKPVVNSKRAELVDELCRLLTERWHEWEPWKDSVWSGLRHEPTGTRLARETNYVYLRDPVGVAFYDDDFEKLTDAMLTVVLNRIKAGQEQA